jgi:hypothetical protein
MITNPRIWRYFARAAIFLAMVTFIVGTPGFHGVGSGLSFPLPKTLLLKTWKYGTGMIWMLSETTWPATTL